MVQPIHSSSEGTPANPASAAEDIRLEKAIQLFYDTNWQDAQTLLDELKNDYRNDPTVFFYDSMLPFWAYFFAGGRSEQAQDFLSKSEKAIDISMRHLRTARNDTSTVLLLSGLYGYRSLVAASEKEYRTAIRSAMTGFGYTRQLLALNSDDPNAQMGRGVFNYMMGTIPSEIRWVTSFAGLSGDRESGFMQLEKAAGADTYVSRDALMILTYLYLRDEQYEDALRTSSLLVEKHPQNLIFKFYKAKSLEKNGEVDEAIVFFQSISQSTNTGFSYLIKMAEEEYQRLSNGS
ncbi:MAG: TTC39/IML2 family protein [Balneolales bacterium]|nr:TTC39/IML2 family protein [Balneolales bacterium]